MPKMLLDHKEVEFAAGENIIEIAKRYGTLIPHFCYHPGLSIVAQCRMCAIEIEGNPKVQTACSTPATEGMKVLTKSPKAIDARQGTMEFLLVNHPLDCPICDKSGECTLQDNSFLHGAATTRYQEERRTFLDVDMGEVIQKNMNRCIHCTRCIRFGDEIAKKREMVAIHRGNATEITTIHGKALETAYAGNYADICPTGSLTLKDFRFHKRVWFLHKTKTLCPGCSKGCSMELHHEHNKIYRTLAAENKDVNGFWICDEGRALAQRQQKADRYQDPYNSRLKEVLSWEHALNAFQDWLSWAKEHPTQALVAIGTDVTHQEAQAILDFFKPLELLIGYFNTPKIEKPEDDASEDGILRRLSKTGNLHGIVKLGIPFWKTLSITPQKICILRGGQASLEKTWDNLEGIAIGVFFHEDTLDHKIVLPTPAFGEKNGTMHNADALEQALHQAVHPPKNCKSLAEIFKLLQQRKVHAYSEKLRESNGN